MPRKHRLSKHQKEDEGPKPKKARRHTSKKNESKSNHQMPSTSKKESKKSSPTTNNNKTPTILEYELEEQPLMPSLFFLMKEIHPDVGISKYGVEMLNDVLLKIFDMVADEAMRIMQMSKGSNLKEQDLECAIKFILPKNMGKAAMKRANRKVGLYKAGRKDGSIP